MLIQCRNCSHYCIFVVPDNLNDIKLLWCPYSLEIVPERLFTVKPREDKPCRE